MSGQFDLVIIGGGMVGNALACALADTDLSIALIETQLPSSPSDIAAEVFDVDMRVSALNRASENFLRSVGAWDNMTQERLSPYDKMRVWDGEGTGHIQFDSVSMGESHLGHIVENRVTASALLKQMQSQKNLRLLAPSTVKEIETLQANEERDGPEYFIHLDDDQVLHTPLIVAADGARSFVRQWGEFESREWDYEHHGLVCTIETERPNEACAWQRFTETGVLAFLPLKSDGEKNLVSIVWSCPEQQAQSLLALSEEEFNAELSKSFEYKLGNVLASGPRAAIPLRQRHAKRYIKTGVVLVGDAAHTIHPLAGQGVNLGLMDAYVLADEIKQGLVRGIKPQNDQLLARYERRRMPENLTMMATMESFKRLFAQKAPALRWLRNWGMNKVNQLGFVKNHIVQEAMGLKREIR
jgi:2-octaprenylphenol hydroxylase